MRQSRKAWIWSSNGVLTAGSPAEVNVQARAGEDPAALNVLKGRSRDLLPRT
ncbi:hypothetical protein GCM10010912_44260 [Paenibacillus albidus]|uniref:Uncharacterized protein n=1 Tax=Paenibacillus albidus TaxID=2041023 RepID=A0A917CQI4_9BACL|nr:hypothetical protein [Paenibacillus albidus]GGF94471.1 hypothetical protein GCM10010912_44260 [Paenibacillus albidus]